MRANICEECGIPESEWKANNGEGYARHNVRYCCQGCFLGIGCSCKETGVRRVVVVNQQQNKTAYVKKMDRQVKEWESKIASLEASAKERSAEKNTAVRREMSDLRRKINDTRSQLDKVKTDPGAWPQESRSVSTTYKKMKDLASSAGSRIKRK